mmetsp:Transcript_3915/g.6384  ORF Transcript_3915/g.6384 Transcript_3915/m.6384 type:complete len:211 (-) Transcript_3915:155-787(-)
MRFPCKPRAAPSCNDTIVTPSSRRADDVDHLILVENAGNRDLFFKQVYGKIDLLRWGATIDLDLFDVSLLLANLHLAHLRVADRADHLAIFLRPLDFGRHWRGFRTLAGLAPSLLVLGECLVLSLVPTLVETALDFITQVTGPNRSQGTEATRSFDISYEADTDHWRCLQDRDTFHHFFLVQLGARSLHLSHDVCHSSLVGHEGCQMRRL